MKRLISITIAAAIMALPCLLQAQTKSNKSNTSPVKLDRSKQPLPAPAPTINIGKYESFEMDNGLKVFVVENHKIPRVSYSLTLDYNPVPEGDLAGLSDVTGQMLRTGTTNLSKDELDEEVDFIGARLSTSSTGVYASSLKKHNDKLLSLMADVLLNPSFKQEEFDKIKTQTISGLKSQQDDAGAISNRISSQLIYGKDHPYGESITEKSIENITPEQCRKYYETFFKPNVGYLAIVGDITLDEAKALVKKHLGSWQKGEVMNFVPETPQLPKSHVVAIVDRPGAVQSALRVGYPVDLKPSSPDAIPARVMNTILGGGAFRLFNNLREDKAYTYGAYSQLSSDKLIGKFMVNTEIRNSVTDSAINEIFFEMERIAREPVENDELNLVKNYLNGNFALSLENPQTIAGFAISTARYGLPADFYANYMKNLSAVTSDDVMNAAKRYIRPENAYILAVGKASEIAPRLMQFTGGQAIKYFDFDGKEYDPNKKVKPVPEGVTAESVNQMYINAIGGEKALKKIKDMTMMATTNMQGMTIGFDIYRKAPDKYMMKVGAGEMVFQKMIYDGTNAKLVSPMGGENKTLEGAELEDMKVDARLNAEMFYPELGVKLSLDGIEEVNGSDAYRMILTMPSGKETTAFFDVTSGLKVKEIGDQGVSTFSDYREVNGVKFPYALTQQMGPQTVEMKVLTIKINSKLKDDLFTIE
ncbi:MAG: pitrilysin family protein [Lentimicrobium sp.]|jgi:predicted Zn-dependent peptidase|nr:pitrilysin family protein [Lentimicrobium sp.]